VLASAAVPAPFEAVELHGHDHQDGLCSQNPPIDDLLTVAADRKPEELRVVQVDPQRTGEPTSLEAIRDRRNELAGNLSLNQKLRTVERVNEWIDRGHLPESEFRRVAVDRIEMDRTDARSTKLDRAAGFVEEPMDPGERRAAGFLADRADAPAGTGTD
jgi:NTE family protein